MRGWKLLLIITWKIIEKGNNKNEENFLNYSNLAPEEVPKYCNMKHFNFAPKYGDEIEGSVPKFMLKWIF